MCKVCATICKNRGHPLAAFQSAGDMVTYSEEKAKGVPEPDIPTSYKNFEMYPPAYQFRRI